MEKASIVSNVEVALKKIGISPQNISLDQPTNSDFGDFATSIALKLSKKLKKNPYELAQEIMKHLPKDPAVEKVEVIKPGFINFWISKNVLLENLLKIVSDKKIIFESPLFKDKKIIFEYTDPNPFKEFHIGHLYSNAVGESLARITTFLGATVKRANYYGDVGMHVAKSIWGMEKKLKDEKVKLSDLEKKPLNDRIKFLGQAYALGAQAYESDKDAKEEMKDINYAVFLAGQKYLKTNKGWTPQVDYSRYIEGKDLHLEEVHELYSKGKDWSLAYFEEIYKRLGTKFDYYYPESVVGEYGMKLVKENVKKGIFKESEGAIIFEGDKFGLHTRVFINSLGLPTYEAKELGLAPTKYADFPYDKSYIVTGNEINEYFKVLLTALKQINPELAQKTTHIGHGMVRLPEGKMSSRTGKILTGEWLIESAKNEVIKIMSSSQEGIQNKEGIAEEVGVGAVKYALLKQSIGRDVEFDLKESVSFDGNSGPYLQYTYVRCLSILKKASVPDSLDENEIDLSKEESLLLRTLGKFNNVVTEAGINLSPHLIANYLFSLAQQFSLFYERHPVLKSEAPLKKFRLLLTKATANTLKNGLYLLGIETIERM